MDYNNFVSAMREAAAQSREAKSNMADFQDRINSIGMQEINVRFRVTPADTASALWENRIVDG
jgi:hypothetical protein